MTAKLHVREREPDWHAGVSAGGHARFFADETYVNCVSPILAKTYRVSRQTIYEAINRYRAVRLQASWGSWDSALSAGHAHMARYGRDTIGPVNDEIMPLWFAGIASRTVALRHRSPPKRAVGARKSAPSSCPKHM